MKIGVLSDTHSFLDPTILQHFEDVDEIWHAGDIGKIEIMDQLACIAPVETVYGNIDNHIIQSEYDEYLCMDRSGIKVLMIHIAGKFGYYHSHVKNLIHQFHPKILVCGHSHILKIQYDNKNNLLYVNPGACGHHGFHLMRTILKFEINSGKIENMKVIELGRRGR
ncbi:metallophosphoesterase family protein [Membranihabitans maritimus]|uniref:metallophosphoesterase family protein n=1 Tax=Membranihabitans maritimus TaxID=2904244 RepID=UPI001F3F025D|nr:metallophosphoesterase family protein [Membranihabitans maritimus]